jgi:hypothetical protein
MISTEGNFHQSGGTQLDASQWDGSDFCMVWPLPGFIFVTDRVAQAIRKNKITGATLRLPQDLNFGKGGFGPGRLSGYMSEDRARVLSPQYGIDY